MFLWSVLAFVSIVLLLLYKDKCLYSYRRWYFYRKAFNRGLNLGQSRILWHLIEVYRVKEYKKLLMNSRVLNKTLLKAINDVEMDLSIDLREREIQQYKYYELKRFFDRIQLPFSLRTTKEIKTGTQLLLNTPDNVRSTFIGLCTRVSSRGFFVRLDKLSSEHWISLINLKEFEFIYINDYKIEQYFTSKLISKKEDSSYITLFFKHSKAVQLIAEWKFPCKRFDREALLACAESTTDKHGNRQFSPQKGGLCLLLELSLASAVVKTVENFDMNQFVYLQFMGSTQRVVCYGRIKQIIQADQYKQVHVQFLQTNRASLNQISSLVYDL